MTFLGIDQSYSGFAVTVLGENDHDTTVKSFPPGKYKCDADRLLYVQEHLFNIIDAADEIDEVVMEGYAMASKFGREKAGELGGAVKLELWHHELVPHIVTPTGLKKFVLGSSAGKGKNLMLLGVFKKWGVEFNNDNAADSYACAKVAEALHKGTTLKYEQEVIDVIMKGEK